MKMKAASHSKKVAFTLIEMSIVVMVLALLSAALLRYASAVTFANSMNATNATLDKIETALMNFRYANGRLPCPASLTTGTGDASDPGIENNANFGKEASTAGNCYDSGAIVANYRNASDPDNADSNYDSTTLNEVVAGGIPTKTLELPDKYAYDSWGRRILYAVDTRITSINAFSTYTVTSSTACKPTTPTIGAIVIKKTLTGNPPLASAITCKAIYALVSFGADGHGGYIRKLSVTSPATTPQRYNAGATNADELKNCHCDSTAAATAFDRDFIQQPVTGTGTIGAGFGDIVRFKTRADMASSSETQ